MSQLLVNEYLNELATLKRVSGAQRDPARSSICGSRDDQVGC
ncbi:hypothetical protein [Phenylobacterium sp.]|nr:hypothetical protein [Phenylobacterium sp.]